MAKSLRPYPEALRGTRGGRGWKVVPPAPVFPFMPAPPPRMGCGNISIVDREMQVPTEDSPQAHRTRVHEMLHARFSPRRVPRYRDVGQDAVLAAEDIRIQMIARLNGAGETVQAAILAEVETDAAAMNRLIEEYRQYDDLGALPQARYVALQMFSTTGTLAHDHWRANLEKRVSKSRGNNRAAWQGIYTKFAQVQQRLNEAIHAEHCYTYRSKKQRKNIAPLRTRVLEPLARILHEEFPAQRSPEDPVSLDGLERDGLIRQAIAESGTTRFDRPPLSERLFPRIANPIVRHYDYGVIMRAAHRYMVDRMIFKTVRKRVRGGTILIDGSGSMSLTPPQVLAILREAPTSKIAIYSGSENSGTVRILAEKGRRVADKYVTRPDDAGNTIDAPALVWLAKQEGPRYWVSDGGVTGRMDQPHTSVVPGCAAIVKRGGIEQHYSCKRFIAEMTRRRAIRPAPLRGVAGSRSRAAA